MKHNESGFTLIELVVVIVILGILAATALPKFVDLSSEANTAAGKGLCAAINSACAMNFAQYKVGTASVYADQAAMWADITVSGTITNQSAVLTATSGYASTTAPCKCIY